MNNKVAIIGFGVSGQSVARFLLNEGKEVFVFDNRKKEEFDINLIESFSSINFNFENNFFDPKDFEYIVTSPGVHLDIPVLISAKESDIPIKNDITLFIEYFRSKNKGIIIGVTGSNGKSTIVSLLYEYIKGIGKNVILAGNIGNSPLDDLSKDIAQDSIIILELSSYQLELFNQNHYLDICLISNLSSNHLDRYHNKMELYAEAKMMGINKDKTKVVIVADDDGNKKYILPKLNRKNVSLVSFQTPKDQISQNGIYTDDNGDLIFYKNKKIEKIFSNTDNRKIKGLHNLYNIGLVYCIICLLDFDYTKEKIIRDFTGLEHRIEFVRKIKNVDYYNDSKSTSPDAIRVAIETLTNDKNIILILGGQDKDMDFNYLSFIFEQYVKKIILLPGNIDKKIIKLAEKIKIDLFEMENMQKAVEKSTEIAEEYDIVLLSPGAASFSLYKNFEQRGKHFKELVNSL